MSTDDDATIADTANTLYSDQEGKVPIIWDKNTASIPGTLAAVGRAIQTQRPHLYKYIVTGVIEDRGITYIDNPAQIDFIENNNEVTTKEAELPNAAYSFDKPCPPTVDRVRCC